MSHDFQFLLYTTPNSDVKINAVIKDETIWLTQKAMADLFDVDRSVITKHLGNIFKDNELEEDSVCANFAHTAKDGKTYNTNFYNLDAIISVGYRVNSSKATQFRIWATNVLKEFVIKGFVLDDDAPYVVTSPCTQLQGLALNMDSTIPLRYTQNDRGIARNIEAVR